MRDPDGHLEFTAKTVRRTINPDAESVQFLKTDLSHSLVQERLLVDFEFKTNRLIESPRLPFVSYPSEWCDAQIGDAANFTLSISRRIFNSGLELKDASASNVLFEGSTPVFCDHLSFVPIHKKQWWAMGQFARHFLFPLTLAHQANWHAYQAHALSVDGLTPSATANILGLKRFRTGTWPLMLGSRNEGQGHASVAFPYSPLGKGETSYHPMLYSYCEWCLPKQTTTRHSAWSGYQDNRQHYTSEAEHKKRQQVQNWLSQVAPKWVIDLGCNTGEYSHIAAQTGAAVIAIDADHDSISQLYTSLRKKKIKSIFPVIANLANLHAGGGWLGQERAGLVERLSGQADMVLCLGLLHHLIASEGISLNRVASFLSQVSEQHLILELIAPEDPMAELLMRQRNRTDAFPTISKQLEALSSTFQLESRESLGYTRELALLKKMA